MNKFFPFIFLLVLVFCSAKSKANYSYVTLSNDTIKSKQITQNDSLKKVGYLSYKYDFTFELRYFYLAKDFHFSSLIGNDSLIGPRKNNFSGDLDYYQLRFIYAGVSIKTNFISTYYGNDSLKRSIGGLSLGIPIKRFSLNFNYENYYSKYKYEYRSISSKSFHTSLGYRPFKSRYVNCIENPCYSQIRSAFAIDLFVHHNFLGIQSGNNNDSIFTKKFTQEMWPERVHRINYISLSGFSVSGRISANLVLFKSLYLNLVMESGFGRGRGKFLYNKNTILNATCNPINYKFTGGLGMNINRFAIKAFMSYYGTSFDFYYKKNDNYKGLITNYNDYLAFGAGIAYRFKEPKKLNSLRSKIIKKSKDRINSIASPE